MKSFITSYKYSLAALAVVLLISISTVVFGETTDTIKQDDAVAKTEDCKLKAYTDPQVMAATMADPAKFMEFLAIFNDPQVPFRAMNTCLDQEQFNEIMAYMSNPASWMSASAQFMNPQMYMNWTAAMMNPAFYTSAMNTYMNPQLYMNYMAAFMNPAYYAQFTDPKFVEKSTSWMMDPTSFQKMFEGMYNIAPVVADATPSK